MDVKITESFENKTENIKLSKTKMTKIFYTFIDDDMTSLYIDLNSIYEQNKLKQGAQQDQQFTYQEVNKVIQEEPEQIKIEKQGANQLDLEIGRNKLNFGAVYGQIFLMLKEAKLIGEQKGEDGSLLLTNYRVVFFKGKQIKLDLPFGFISEYKMNNKQSELTVSLKWKINWKFEIKNKEKQELNQMAKVLLIYCRPQKIVTFFAFAYARKYPDKGKKKYLQLVDEFQRLGFKEYRLVHELENSFLFSQTYPESFYTPLNMHQETIAKIAKYWTYSRLPILTYIHTTNSKQMYGLWRSSSIVCDKTENLQQIIKYLEQIRNDSNKLTVFDAGFKKFKKGLQESEIDSLCEMKYLEICQLQNIKVSYLAIMQCFLKQKKNFIKDLLASKWYDVVLQFLKGAFQISNKLRSQNNVLVKCQSGMDRSAVLAALAQIILNPYYRTYKGFETLVHRQFHYFGHPFRSRLGFAGDKKEQIPIFTIFLDCVSQLINTNQMCFQYNYKYLSNLSNLMYTCCYGTFLTNCRKEIIDNHVEEQTVPIWQQLISQLTQNAFYRQENGILQVPFKFDHLRIWKEHFWYLTSPPKETYQIHPLAEDNSDYIGLLCIQAQAEKNKLQSEIEEQKNLIEKLKQQIQSKTKIK